MELILLLACVYSSNYSAHYSTKSNFGIVTKNLIPSYYDQKGTKENLKLSEGEKVEIISEATSRLSVLKMNGTKVFINADDVEII